MYVAFAIFIFRTQLCIEPVAGEHAPKAFSFEHPRGQDDFVHSARHPDWENDL